LVHEIGQFFSRPECRLWLVNALKLAAATTVLATVLALPLALLADRYAFSGKSLATGMLLAPMILPPFVGALAVEKMLSLNGGSINLILMALRLPQVNVLAGSGVFYVVVALEVLHLYPIMFLNAAAALANIDPAMGEAARNLGASRWRVFWRVTLPLMRPGLFAGATIIFIWSFCEIGTPLMVGFLDTLPVKIYDNLRQLETTPSTYVMVLMLLSASVGLYAIGRWLFGRTAGAMAARASTAATQRRVTLAGSLLCWLPFVGVTLLAALPHAGVVLMSLAKRWDATILPTAWTLEHMRAVFREERTWNAIANSLNYAAFRPWPAYCWGWRSRTWWCGCGSSARPPWIR
jgi:iron(III) transport system permease protein